MVLRGCTSKLLRWPILLVVFCILGIEFIGYLFVRTAVQIFELGSSVRHRAVKKKLKNATDFVSWCQSARELDRLELRTAWHRQMESPYYDFVLVKEHRDNLIKFRRAEDYDSLLELLKRILQTYNVGGINNAQLYSQTHFGTKELIEDFLQTILECCIVIRDAEIIPLQNRREFFRRARKWYGKSALLLSGGAAMGYFHIGAIKTLIEAKCMPQILSGASAGSLMCSFVSVRSDQEVLTDLCVPESEKYFRACEEPFCVKFTRWLRYGYAFDKDQWIDQMRKSVTKGDTTFLEAYQMTGRIINISVTGTNKYSPPVILNYRSAPDVVIWSAVLASSAFPNFLAPMELQIKHPRTGKLSPFHSHGKAWFDGTIKNDIPIEQMSKIWDANYFIVSQVNPHLIPLFFAQTGGTGRPAPNLGGKGSHGSGLRGGFILAMLERLLKLDMGKW
jgi:predicted acylesterase/phospholipase RssA